jgi:hypothetical protein
VALLACRAADPPEPLPADHAVALLGAVTAAPRFEPRSTPPPPARSIAGPAPAPPANGNCIDGPCPSHYADLLTGDPVPAGSGGPPPSGRIGVGDKHAFDESTLTPDLVMAKIQAAYFAGLKRCYKDVLKSDPSLRGKVTIAFTVNTTGRAIDGRVTGVSDEVDRCIEGQVSMWRFPIPKDKDGEPTEASFSIALTLEP